jgi:hypothetical protein
VSTRQVGEIYSPEHTRYDEGARYLYSDGAHELVLFWNAPTPAEVEGFRQQPMEVGLFSHGPAVFLLYKIATVCEWSDVAFNLHMVPEAQRQLPDEPPGERARLRLVLVDAESGLIRAKRIVSLDKVMTQALKMTLRAQAADAFNRVIYEAAVQQVYARYPDGDALAAVAEVVEPALG